MAAPEQGRGESAVSMRIAVFGLGYVGFTTLCCLAQEGHEVIGFDVNSSKVAGINDGIAPIIEPGLSEMLRRGLAASASRLSPKSARNLMAATWPSCASVRRAGPMALTICGLLRRYPGR